MNEFSAQDKFGVLNIVLQKHLKLVTYFYENKKDAVDNIHDAILKDSKKHNADIQYRDQKAVGFRNEGNAFFKKGDYQNARIFYSRSLAEAVDGELAALAYFNRSALFHLYLDLTVRTYIKLIIYL